MPPNPCPEKAYSPLHPVRLSRTWGLPWRLAAPSWIVPGPPAASCLLLASRPELAVDEVELLLLETSACRAYGTEDLPPDLAGLPLSWHLHLPLDLPWAAGADAVFDALAGLAGLTAFLRPRACVLHPPKDPRPLAAVVRRWQDAGLPPLLLENAAGQEIARVAALAADLGLGRCLDVGHVLAYEPHFQPRATEEDLAMLHLHAPGNGDGHRALTGLDQAGETLLRALLERLPAGGTIVVEVFAAPALAASLAWLGERTAAWGLL